jgi:hypothetical protein
MLLNRTYNNNNILFYATGILVVTLVSGTKEEFW